VNIWKGEVILWRPKVAKKASPFVFAWSGIRRHYPKHRFRMP
jgi:hypothetical protein